MIDVEVEQLGEDRGGGMTEAKTEWKPDPEVTRAALAEIDLMQAGYPTCVVCGQRCIRLDKYGTCSKVSERSEPHRQHRNEYREAAHA